MVDAGGFEPPTARFVAEYSIQLSYASVVLISYFFYYYFYFIQQGSVLVDLDGGRRRIRTSDRSVRSRVLYPAELCIRLI
jgi:hypothetical protein